MKFSPGQQIVCRRSYFAGPKDGDVVTVKKYSVNCVGYIQLVEYPEVNRVVNLFDERYFEQLIEDSVLESELKKIFE
jgi:hypothetical protein